MGTLGYVMGQPWVLDSKAGSFTLNAVDGILERMWSVHGHVPAMVKMHIGIAVSEIAGNIVEHAGSGREGWVRMEARVGANEVRVDFVDDGSPTMVDLDEVSLPDEMAETGRGLALARAVLRTLSYRRNGLNHWTLVSHPFR